MDPLALEGGEDLGELADVPPVVVQEHAAGEALVVGVNVEVGQPEQVPVEIGGGGELKALPDRGEIAAHDRVRRPFARVPAVVLRGQDGLGEDAGIEGPVVGPAEAQVVGKGAR
jgi:hypothetical protein